MVLAIDLMLITAIMGLSSTIWYNNILAFRDPNYCMETPSAFLYSVAAGHTGWSYGGFVYWLIAAPLMAGAMTGLWFLGAHITFYALALLQVLSLGFIFISHLFGFVKPCN